MNRGCFTSEGLMDSFDITKETSYNCLAVLCLETFTISSRGIKGRGQVNTAALSKEQQG